MKWEIATEARKLAIVVSMILFLASLALLGLGRAFLDPYPGPMLKLDIALSLLLFLALAVWLLLILRKPRRDSATETPAGQAACAECKGVFYVQDMIMHNGVHVCASCKPCFLQKLKEGVEKKDARDKSALVPLAIIAACVGALILLFLFFWYPTGYGSIISR